MREDLILGLDLGTNSLGWALLSCIPETKEITGIVDAGSRVFEAGMDGDISSGRAESRCAERRAARMIRRNLDRRRRRMTKLKNLLQEYELLPKGDDIEKILKEVDEEVKEYLGTIPKDLKPDVDILAHTWPYFTRAVAAGQSVPPTVLGRAIYHLAQRRGFWSNRKSQTEEKELGQVKQGIAELEQNMDEAGAKTLGEYFAWVNPLENRIRTLWTSRQMYKTEFDAIMAANTDKLNDQQVERLKKAIFFQRKLKSQKSLIGKCPLEKGKRRTPWYRREAQKFRYLQTVNNLRVITYDGELRTLTDDERNQLSEILSGETGLLDKDGNLRITKARKLLGLHKNTKFTIEEGGEKTFKGDRTTAKIMNVLGEKWLELPHETQEKLIHDLHSFEKTKPLINRLINNYYLKSEEAELLAQTALEPDFANLSLKAIRRILPYLEKGLSYSEALKEEYPEVFESTGAVEDVLPPLKTFAETLRNPVVERSLNELRQVVNGIIREYGKPGIIRLELARDIKRSTKEKQRMTQNNRNREKERNQALDKIRDEFPSMAVSRDDITKILLAEECDYICPYTGKSISITSLIGPHPQFDIEHIIPRSRSMDNSFINKTLCYHPENRNVKKNRTPYETYHGTQKYEEILQRVSRFNGSLARRKLELFKMTPEEVEANYEDFSNRQLNDTRYAAKEAAAYLGMLYGGVIKSIDGKRRVNVLSGGLTALVRSFHGLNGVLNDGGIKSRDDHRHHAVDAVAIGVTSPAMVKRLSDSIRVQEMRESSEHIHTSGFDRMETWPGMLEETRAKVSQVIASHHVSKKVRGGFHEETFYSKDHEYTDEKGRTRKYKHVTVELPNLEQKRVGDIVDDGARRAVEARLTEVGEKDPKKAFRNYENLPELVSRDGRTKVPIRKVKIRRSQNTIQVGKGKRARNVVSGNNHHMAIYAELDEKGNDKKWVGEVVTLLEAKQRLKEGKPIVNRDAGPGRRFVMSVKCGDVFGMDFPTGRELVITRCVPQMMQISFVRMNDARLQKEIKNSHEWFTKVPNTMRTSNPVKYTIDPLGRLRRAND